MATPKGWHPTEEQREKLRAAQKANWARPGARERQSARGKVRVAADGGAQMRAAAAARWAKPGARERNSATLRALWADPEIRGHWLRTRNPQRSNGVDTPHAICRPRPRDIGWAAGFIEGEGTFGKLQSSVIVYQVNREPLICLQQLLGGTILGPYASGRLVGRVGKQYVSQPGYRWQVSGPRARGVIMTLLVFLSAKRRAQALRSFWVTRNSSHKRKGG